MQGEAAMTPNGPRVKFVDFWPGFRTDDNQLYRVLREHFGIVPSDDPDYLVYSVFGGEHVFNHRYDRCVKILWTGESVRPNFNICDYALSFDYSDDSRNLRWPLFALGAPALVRPPVIYVERILAEKTLFCNFLYSNANCQKRIEFFNRLSRYKRVDSGGAVLTTSATG